MTLHVNITTKNLLYVIKALKFINSFRSSAHFQSQLKGRHTNNVMNCSIMEKRGCASSKLESHCEHSNTHSGIYRSPAADTVPAGHSITQQQLHLRSGCKRPKLFVIFKLDNLYKHMEVWSVMRKKRAKIQKKSQYYIQFVA